MWLTLLFTQRLLSTYCMQALLWVRGSREQKRQGPFSHEADISFFSNENKDFQGREKEECVSLFRL